MTTTPNLLLTHLEENASSPEVRVNEMADGLDYGMNSYFVKNFASDANLTLSVTGVVPQEWQHGFINLTDSGVVLTTGRNVVVPVNEKKTVFKNSTAQTLTIKTSAGTGIALTTGSVQCLQCDGTNVISADGGGGSFLNNIVEDATPQLGGDLDCNGNQIQWSKGADVASATALAVLTDGNYYDVTGTTTITSINTTGGTGTLIKVHFDGALTLTHHATNLILPGAVSITTAAGDEAEFIEYGAGVYRCTNYMRASGLPVVGSGATDTDAIHLSTGGEIAALTTVTAASGDYVLIEDVSDSNNKKKVLVSDFTGGAITEPLMIALGDETAAITTGLAKVTFRMPYAFTLTAVRASLTTASSSGVPTFDINETGVSVLSTKLTIDASEKTSTTAATAAVISDAALADDAEITIDVDVAGTGAAGAKIYLIGTQT
jgi:hypothetical protein